MRKLKSNIIKTTLATCFILALINYIFPNYTYALIKFPDIEIARSVLLYMNQDTMKEHLTL